MEVPRIWRLKDQYVGFRGGVECVHCDTVSFVPRVVCANCGGETQKPNVAVKPTEPPYSVSSDNSPSAAITNPGYGNELIDHNSRDVVPYSHNFLNATEEKGNETHEETIIYQSTSIAMT